MQASETATIYMLYFAIYFLTPVCTEIQGRFLRFFNELKPMSLS